MVLTAEQIKAMGLAARKSAASRGPALRKQHGEHRGVPPALAMELLEQIEGPSGSVAAPTPAAAKLSIRPAVKTGASQPGTAQPGTAQPKPAQAKPSQAVPAQAKMATPGIAQAKAGQPNAPQPAKDKMPAKKTK